VDGATTTYAEVVAGVRAAIAGYTQALDDGRTDDVVATYCPDGAFELPGTGTFAGHDALRSAYAGWVPQRPQRHLVVNTLVSDWSDHEATATSDVVLLVEGKDGWAVRFVARYRDLLHHTDGAWKFHRRTVS
jgi:ketosteroid isomerase-like protein